MADDIKARLRKIDHMSVEDCFLQSYMFDKAADHIEALESRIAELEGRLSFWANKKTIDEIMRGELEDDEWSNMTPEQRIKLMGERKRKHDEEVLLARAALNQEAGREG